MLGFGPRSYAQTANILGGSRLGLNVVKNMCSAVTAKITKNRPKPTFLPNTAYSENAYSIKERAQKLEKFIEGLFYEVKLYDLAPTVFLHACIWGTGVLHVFEEHDSIKVEPVFPFELRVSDDDAMYGAPRCIYRKKYIDRLVLAELFPDKRDEILEAARDTDYEGLGYDPTADQILVTWSWHLPSGPSMEETDGAYACTIENATLEKLPYEEESFPFAFVRWSQAPMGFWGIGLAEELTGIQLEINKLLREIQTAHHLLGKTKVMLERGSKVVKAHYNNEWGTFLEFTGTPPIVVPPQIVAPELYQHLWNLYAKAYEIAGISQMSAQSQKPEGVDSAIAMRTLSDTETERFVVVGRQWEGLFLQVSDLAISLAKRMTKAPKVRAMAKSYVESIEWKDVDMKRDEYFMQAFPASMLPSTPAGRLSFVNDLQQLGMPPDDALELIDIPDTEKYLRRRNARRLIVERNIERMLNADSPEYVSPEPLDDHDVALKLVTQAYAEARLDGVPDECLEMLDRYAEATKKFMSIRNQQPAPPPGPPMGGPPVNYNAMPPPPGAPPAGPPMGPGAAPMGPPPG